MIFENVRNALAEQFEIDPESITMETNLIDDLGADSLDVVELIMSLEDMFGLTISDEDVAQLYTVSRIVDYLEKTASHPSVSIQSARSSGHRCKWQEVSSCTRIPV